VPLLIGVGLSGAAAQWLLSTAFRNAGAAVVIASNILMIWRESRLGRISEARFRAEL